MSCENIAHDECSTGGLDELVRHNSSLVKTAGVLRKCLKAAHESMCICIDLAEPVAELHEEEPSEYIIHADNIDDMRKVLVDFKTMNNCWFNGEGDE